MVAYCAFKKKATLSCSEENIEIAKSSPSLVTAAHQTTFSHVHREIRAGLKGRGAWSNFYWRAPMT